MVIYPHPFSLSLPSPITQMLIPAVYFIFVYIYHIISNFVILQHHNVFCANFFESDTAKMILSYVISSMCSQTIEFLFCQQAAKPENVFSLIVVVRSQYHPTPTPLFFYVFVLLLLGFELCINYHSIFLIHQ